jgi:hypothetical protein
MLSATMNYTLDESEGDTMPSTAAPPNNGSMSDSSLDIDVIEFAQQAFREALPGLLKDHRGQWVAFNGATRLGFDRSKRALYNYCIHECKVPLGQFLVRLVQEDDSDEMTIGGSVVS